MLRRQWKSYKSLFGLLCNSVFVEDLCEIKMKLTTLIVLLIGVIGTTTAARILAVMPFPGKSHYIFISSVLKSLTEKGHQVVEYSPFVPKKPIPNHTHVHLTSEFEKKMKNSSYDDFKKMTSGTTQMFGHVFLWFMVSNVCDSALQQEPLQKLLKSNEKFDLVITESTFAQEPMLAFGHKFNAPTITLQGFGLQPILNRDAGNALSIASIPDMTSFAITDHMSFVERGLNLFTNTVILAAYYLWYLPSLDKMVKQHYPLTEPPPPPVSEMVSNISLYLVNTHPAIAYVQPSTPNIIPIAGITISPDRTPLPKDLQGFMDGAKEGVIYFSLGTVVPAHLLPPEMLQIFVKVFGKLKQKVLWKIELDSLPNLSINVKLVNWVPQPGILAHPNTKLFLTHGGLFSQQEALHAGVPTVGIPFFGDQPYNIRLSEHRGFGVKLDFNTLSEQSLYNALATVLENPRYRENAQRLSKIFRDRPVSPKDSVVFWVEYVLRHRGAPHLRPVASKLPWYQLSLLDVAAFISLISAAVVMVTYLIIKRILSALCGGKTQEKKVSTKKKQN